MTCPSRKIGYVSRREAITGSKNSPGPRQRPYHCGNCDLWHTTSMSSADLRRVRKRDRVR